MNIPIGQLRVCHHALRFRAGLRSRPSVVTMYFRLLHSPTRRSGRPSDVTVWLRWISCPGSDWLERSQACPPQWTVPFLTRAFLLSLAAPPTGTPLRGRGAFRSSLEGIPPTVPSFQPAPPPFDERAIPLAQNKKGTSCPQKPLNPPRNPKPSPPAQKSR